MFIFHSGSLPRYGINRIFQLAAESGFDGIEIEVNDNYDTHDATYLKSLEREYQIPIRAFSIHQKCEETHIKAFQYVTREFEHVTINLASPEMISQSYRSWMEDVLPRFIEKYSIEACYKNTPKKAIFSLIPTRTDNSLISLKQKGNICMDLTALAAANEDIMRSVNTVGNSLRCVYLSNMHHNEPYSLPMEGVLPMESFLKLLRQKSYTGLFSLKVKPSFLGEGSIDVILDRLKNTREYFNKYFVGASAYTPNTIKKTEENIKITTDLQPEQPQQHNEINPPEKIDTRSQTISSFD